MKFGAFPVTETEGMILAHSVRCSDQLLKKGLKLRAEDIKALTQAGHKTVYAASLDETDVPEDEAAAYLANALAGQHAHANAPFTGRANIHATEGGVLTLNEDLISAINAVDEAITVATLTDREMVHDQQMLATVKIIPFAVSQELLDQTLELAAVKTNVVSVAPFAMRRADLILTTQPHLKPSLLTKAEHVIAHRLQALGIKLTSVRHCAHDEGEVADCLAETPDGSDITLILGASATGDRCDVVPAGIVAAGGTIKHFGMPVDPGNLLLLASIGKRPVLGLPGCARSPRLNGTDWVLQRLAAGLEIRATDIQAMGVGGLLKEIPSRPQPRARKISNTSHPRVAAIILAAGQSRRMGKINKLTEMVNGRPMVAHVADAALSSKADEIILVTGHQKNEVLTALGGRPMTYAHNPQFDDGQSGSVRAGIKAVSELIPPVDAAIILLGDMPWVDADLINQLIAAHNQDEDKYICLPTVDGKRGNPVLWDAAFFPELQTLEGDVGAKHLIAENADLVCEVAVAGHGALTDIDTPQMLERLNRD
ncbi:MAG: 4-diphosphocytidyl-2C-methyl-D-erythritol kinase [Rhodobiaceae bacterium]|nr:MAG: 4-diphosphocytidyl-2C-methyl-D-erythritol kinase [Rhodobiaceae bacterium]